MNILFTKTYFALFSVPYCGNKFFNRQKEKVISEIELGIFFLSEKLSSLEKRVKAE